MNRSRLGWALALAALIGGGAACFQDIIPGEDEAACTLGEADCACYPNQTCNAGLECVDDRCQAPVAEESESSESSNSSNSSNSSSDDDGSTDTTDETTDSSESESSETETDSADETETGPPPGTCRSSADCSDTELCDFADDQCGALGLGECVPRPADCNPNGFEVTGCDCVIYPSSCEANMAGADFKCIGGCC